MLVPILEYEVEEGSPLDDCIREGIEEAKKVYGIVKFNYQGVCIKVSKDSDIKERLEYYHNILMRYTRRKK